jgi:polyisoprenoid-binding protein YceI
MPCEAAQSRHSRLSSPIMWKSPCLLSLLLLATAVPATARTLSYRIDPVHTQVLFSADHDGYSQPVGRLTVKAGWLQFDEDDWSGAKVVVDVDTSSVDLGDKEWNDAVSGKRFLDAKDFPLAHFESTSVEKGDANHGTLHGNLTLRGVPHEIAIPFTFNRAGATIFAGMQTLAGFSAQATLDRTQFGITAFPKAVGTQVTLRLEVEAILDQDAQKEYESQRNMDHAAAQH